MNKKTLILTHPLTGNYGGILQAYACYTVLDALACNPYIYRYIPDDAPAKSFSYLKYYGSCLKFAIGMGRKANPDWRRWFIANKFTENMRSYSEPFPSVLDAEIRYLVGSDQVWRAVYCRKIKSTPYFFLDFATELQRKNSITYAASFGVDEWEGTPEETEICKKLLSDFKAVSVREDSGVGICKEVFGIDAVQMPDPTLLLHKQDYDTIIERNKTWACSRPWLAAYVLDESPTISHLLTECAKDMNLSLQSLRPNPDAVKLRDRLAVTVPQWLRLIRDSDFFITDSFHGCVFAIILNKPFACLGNANRGNARFESLLGQFGLTNRMLCNPSPGEILSLASTPIDWSAVNEILATERTRGINFLRRNLLELK